MDDLEDKLKKLRIGVDDVDRLVAKERRALEGENDRLQDSLEDTQHQLTDMHDAEAALRGLLEDLRDVKRGVKTLDEVLNAHHV